MSLSNYWNGTFIPEMSRTTTQGNQFGSSVNPMQINYVEKWAFPDEQYPKFKSVNTTYEFGTYPNEYFNAWIPASYMSSVSAGDDQPNRVFYWQYNSDTSLTPVRQGSVGFHFPGRTSLTYDIINHKYI